MNSDTTIAVGMPRGTCWANSDFNYPTRPGYYRVARHINALEFFSFWDGRKWKRPTTSATKAQVLSLGSDFDGVAETQWWRELEPTDPKSLLDWEPEPEPASPTQPHNPQPVSAQLRKWNGRGRAFKSVSFSQLGKIVGK